MNNLIRRSDAIEWLKEACKAGDIDPYTSNQRKRDFEEAINCIEEIPIAEPKRGEWIWDKDGIDWNIGAWRCSNCHGRNANLPNDERIIPLQWSGSNFCPNCGADMRGKANEM